MGHCISLPVKVPEVDHPTTHVVLGNKWNTKARLRKQTWSSPNSEKSLKASCEGPVLEDERHSRKPKGFGSFKGVVIIPEATDRFSDNTNDGGYAITSPAMTISTTESTTVTSVQSCESLPHRKDSFVFELNLTNGAVGTPLFIVSPGDTSANVETIESDSVRMGDVPHPHKNDDSLMSYEVGTMTVNENAHRLAQNSACGRKSNAKSLYNAVMKDFKHPDSTGLHDADMLLPASFTPIKQTSLQNKVSVIREEDDLEAPSDEEDISDKSFLRKIQKDLNMKGKISGPLTPVKLRTQWKTTHSSIQVRDPSIWPNSSATGINSPMVNDTCNLSNVPQKESTNAVDDSLVNNFQKLKLQVAVAEQQEKRNQKVLKIEDRLRDVQGYRELWGDFQQIQDQVKAFENREDQGNNESLVEQFEYDLEDDGIVFSSRKKKTQIRSNREAEKSTERQTRNIDHSSSTHDKEQSQWIFDFQADGLDVVAASDDDDSSQASLSLLSDKNMEVQRRLFAEKRKERKRKKKLQKQSANTLNLISNTVSINDLNTNLENEGDSCRDYGPSNKNRKLKPCASDERSNHERKESVITDMEVAFHESFVSSANRKLSLDADSCSLISDLADDQSCSISVASSQFSRDNDSICGSNDYRVNRRHHRKHSRLSMNVDKHVATSLSTDTVAERRKAIEERLLLLNSKQNDNVPETSCRQSDLTRKFNEVILSAPTTVKQNKAAEDVDSSACDFSNNLHNTNGFSVQGNMGTNRVKMDRSADDDENDAKTDYPAQVQSESKYILSINSNLGKFKEHVNMFIRQSYVPTFLINILVALPNQFPGENYSESCSSDNENQRGILLNPGVSNSFHSWKECIDGKDVKINLQLANEVADTVKTILDKYRSVEQ